MQSYNNFIGIDIGKLSFVVAVHGANTTKTYDNSPEGISKFTAEHQDILPNSLAILETTGGYELNLAYYLLEQGFKLHRADTRKVKSFIRSWGSHAKTDALDAKALALYGHERCDKLDLFVKQSSESIELFQLVQRRNDLKTILVAEKNRLKAPVSRPIKKSISAIIEAVEHELKTILERIQAIIEDDQQLKKQKEILKTIPGIGDIVASELLVLLPELGSICRKKIASLAGVAPKANDSGKFSGYRKTGRGRNGIKPILFLAAMAARNSKTRLRDFYEKLTSSGKKKMVALTALMRKILVIANAKIKELNYVKT